MKLCIYIFFLKLIKFVDIKMFIEEYSESYVIMY